jgi:hypothetical protein
VIVRRLRWAALWGASLLPAAALPAAEPAPLPLAAASPNQQLADAAASRLRQSGLLKDFHIDVAVKGGAVELTGTVSDQAQRDEATRLVQGLPGVSRVLDKLTVAGAIRRVQDTTAAPPVADQPGKLPPPPPVETNGKGNGIPEPLPVFRAGVPAYYGLNPPPLPPHAWPTYAPYNNYSRVAYPQAYPYNSWPFMGPVYPFPKVPLGWRAIKLEWDDGYWWYGRVGHKHDWWKLRFH